MRETSDNAKARQPRSRKTSFRDPESETITVPLTSHQEEEKEEDD